MSEQPMTQLIVLDIAKREASATEHALALKSAALEGSALIAKVTNAAEQDAAVKAQTELHRVRTQFNKAEEAAKAPINAMRTAIIGLGKTLTAELDTEGMRLARIVGDFQEKERVRMLAEQEAARKGIEALKRQELEAVAKASTLEAQDAVKEQFAQMATNAAQTVSSAPKAKGQATRTEWEVEVYDVGLLYRCHSTCCKITPILTEIKQLLELGIEVKGVRAKKVVLSGVRLAPERKALEITS